MNGTKVLAERYLRQRASAERTARKREDTHASRACIGNWLSLSREAKRNLRRRFIYQSGHLALYLIALPDAIARLLRERFAAKTKPRRRARSRAFRRRAEPNSFR